MKKLFKILFISLFILLGCAPTNYYKKDFIDVEKSILLKIGMNQNEVKLIIGEPHYIESTLKEENIIEYKLFYNTRHKVYLFRTHTDTDVIIGNKIIKRPYVSVSYDTTWGFSSESNSLILYFDNDSLTKVEIE
tara:strand:+ start:97 stop:498 length:402 start_codon:yes stop_codon:yes gene_type:complete